MITSGRTFGLLLATSFLVAGTFFQALPADAAQREGVRKASRTQEQYARDQMTVTHARTAKGGQRTRQSAVAKAATGRIVNDASRPPLADSKVRQIGYLEDYGTGCGPVCDCGSCGVEPVCGFDEPACGFEVGCGIGAAIERSQQCGGCGGVGCYDCCETTCGVEGMYVEGPGCGMEVVGDCSCDACSGCEVGQIPLCIPMLRANWCRFEFFAGAHGYTGPLNFVGADANNPGVRRGTGSFGFYEGFNKGSSLRRFVGCDIASQFGLRATQSNLSGAGFTSEARYQVFVTAGLFRKVDYGLQYGVVFDYLNQDWYFQGDSIQLRGELSWRTEACSVYGFRYMAGLARDSSATIVDDGAGNLITSSTIFEPTDQYRVFYRRLLARGGQWSAFGGWTDRSDGLLGGSLNLPLSRCVSIGTGLTYLIPNEGTSNGGNGGNEEEGWNISLGLVFRPGGPSGFGRYSRPMFDVADNGSFMLDRL